MLSDAAAEELPIENVGTPVALPIEPVADQLTTEAVTDADAL